MYTITLQRKNIFKRDCIKIIKEMFWSCFYCSTKQVLQNSLVSLKFVFTEINIVDIVDKK